MAQEQVCAVIVTYQPDPAALAELLAAIGPQVGGVVVVDNGSSQDLATPLAGAGATLLALGENRGVAAGFNHGIRWARGQGFTSVLLLDQDSIPAPDMVGRLAAASTRLAEQGERVAAVGPQLIDATTGRKTGFARFGPCRFRYQLPAADGEPLRAAFLISSGSLIALRTLQQVGQMDEGLFIDLVDTEWFLRAALQGYGAFGVGGALLHHRLGDASIRVPTAGGIVPVHGPLRHYYIFRNSMLLNRRPYLPRRWKYNNAVQLAGMLVFFSLVTPPRLEHLRMMLRGLWDGWRGKTGRCQDRG
jgi:rhamnosyltransferase